MEHVTNKLAGAPTDGQAPHSTPEAPSFASEAEAKAYWDGVTHGLRCAIGENRRDDDAPPAPRSDREEAAEIFDPSGRRLRPDGWLPAKKARFLLVLVAGGVVADACRAVGMSVASAYALRNRRSGRAFGRMWDAILIHRARCRLADNNLSRAMNGCVDQIVRDGVVVAERRRFDNRLSMAMLTRLDRLAESKTGEETELLRALSEDFETYVEVVESGGDEDAFLEAHRPPEPVIERLGSEEAPAGGGPSPLASARDWSHVEPSEIPVDDLDPNGMFGWSADQRVRAERSHYLRWLDTIVAGEGRLPDGLDCPAAYNRVRRGIVSVPVDGEDEEPLASSPGFPGERDHAKHGGGVLSEAEDRPSGDPPPLRMPGKNENGWQPSTSSTSPAETPSPDAGGGED